jgi:DNA-binding Lrp family transcriptional regulator
LTLPAIPHIIKIMLSDIDLRLIERLEVDGRASYLELARLLDINPSTAAKRVKNLLADEIITVKAIPNPYKLGQSASALIALNVNIDWMDDICNNLKKHFHVNMIVTTFGRFNLVLGVHFPSWDNLIDFISSELPESGKINEIETFFVKNRQKYYLGAPDEKNTEKDTSRIDETDLKMIEELANNGRQSCIYLAGKLGISLSSTAKRLSSLLKEDVIQVRALTDPSRMGYHYNALIFLQAEPGAIERICTRLEAYPETSGLMRLTNGYDIYLSVLAKTAESLYDFVKNKLVPLPGIIKIETLIRGELVKRYYGNYQPSSKIAS